MKLSGKIILVTVADFYGLSEGDMISPCRRSYLVTARWMAMYLARHHTSKSYSQIARYFGGRDHSSIINGVGQIRIRLSEEKRLRDDLTELRQRLGLYASVPARVPDQAERAKGIG